MYAEDKLSALTNTLRVMEKDYGNFATTIQNTKKLELLHNLRSLHLESAKEDDETLLSWKESLAALKIEINRRLEAHRRLALLTFHPPQW
jgi:hypothetical protein